MKINTYKPLTMTSLEIAEYTGKRHDNVMRDIREMLNALSEDLKTEFVERINNLGHKVKQPVYILNEELTLTLVTGYDQVMRNAIIKQWQAMREALAVIKYRKSDTKAQIEAMAIIGHLLPPEQAKEAISYIKANSVVNKITSSIHGFPKMLKKDEMSLELLETRTDVLNKYVKLFEAGLDNNEINEILSKKLLGVIA